MTGQPDLNRDALAWLDQLWSDVGTDDYYRRSPDAQYERLVFEVQGFTAEYARAVRAALGWWLEGADPRKASTAADLVVLLGATEHLPVLEALLARIESGPHRPGDPWPSTVRWAISELRRRADDGPSSGGTDDA